MVAILADFMGTRATKRPINSLTALLLFGSCISQAQWANAILDTLTRTGTTKYTTLQSPAFDTLGYAHVVWRSASYNPRDFRVWYTRNSPGNTWLTPIVVSDSNANSPALAVSPVSGQPFISFEESEAESSEIYLAYLEGNTWRKERLTENTTFDRFSSIAADRSGHLHIAWITQDSSENFKLAYAFGEVGKWQVQTLAGSLNPLLAFVAVRDNGEAHIVYRGGYAPEYHIHHTWNDSAGSHLWNYEVIASGNYADLSSSLVIDNLGVLHLALGGHGPYFDTSPRTVYYLFKPPGGTWQPAEFVAANAYEPSIAFTEDQQPHILWIEMDEYLPVLATGRLFHSHKTNGKWQSVTAIDSDYFFPSFQIDKQGYGHIAASTGGNSGNYDIYHIKSRDVVTSVTPPFAPESTPNSFHLFQNFPNPFNPSTTIQFSIPHVGYLTLKVYNVLGQEANTLLSGPHNAGSYMAIWDASRFPSGVYYYRLQAGPYSQTKKTILLR